MTKRAATTFRWRARGVCGDYKDGSTLWGVRRTWEERMSDLRNRIAWLRRRGHEENGADEHHERADHLSTPMIGQLKREGRLVRLRSHVPENRRAFQRWYADEEIARLLRHDQRPLNEIQSRSYFDTLILPSSARGLSYAIHEVETDQLIGTTALTDFEGTTTRKAYFRIVIGEKDRWGLGYGTEATELVMHEAFERHGLDAVKLEVFRHNNRAARAYLRVGFEETGEHVEWVGRERWELHVLEMELTRERFERAGSDHDAPSAEHA
jgi:RimJ/RimL family protein N-acetyltransferase